MSPVGLFNKIREQGTSKRTAFSPPQMEMGVRVIAKLKRAHFKNTIKWVAKESNNDDNNHKYILKISLVSWYNGVLDIFSLVT